MKNRLKTITFKDVMDNEKGYGKVCHKYFGYFIEGTPAGKLIHLFYDNKKIPISIQFISEKIPDVENIDSLLEELEHNLIIIKKDGDDPLYQFNKDEYDRLKRALKELLITT